MRSARFTALVTHLAYAVLLLSLHGCLYDANYTLPDRLKPAVVAQSPGPNAKSITSSTNISATFSEAISCDDMTLTTVHGLTCTGTYTVSPDGRSVTFVPEYRLSHSTKYTATIPNVKDRAGNVLGSLTWSFTTNAPQFTVNPTPVSTMADTGLRSSLAVYSPQEPPTADASPADPTLASAPVLTVTTYISYQNDTDRQIYIISTDNGTDFKGPYKVNGPSETIVTEPALAVDSTGTLHIVYQYKNGPDLWIMYNTTSTADAWPAAPTLLFIISNPSPTNGEADPAIALDDNGKVHISFYDANTKALRYFTNKNAAWKDAIVEKGATAGNGAQDDPGRSSSIKVDASGFVHLSYYDGANKSLKYASGIMDASGTWQPDEILTLDSKEDMGKYSLLVTRATTTADNPRTIAIYIAYYDAKNKAIKLINRKDNMWTSSTIVSKVSGETACPLALDGSGDLYLSYYSGGRLYYASMGANWQPNQIDSGLGNGVHLSLALDANSLLHISYYDAVKKDLNYAHEY